MEMYRNSKKQVLYLFALNSFADNILSSSNGTESNNSDHFSIKSSILPMQCCRRKIPRRMTR